MYIRKDGKLQITPHLNEQELYSTSPDAPGVHYLSDTTIEAVQWLRSYYGVPVEPTSTYRTEKHNADVGGGTQSQHLKGNAIDFVFLDGETTEKLNQDIAERGPVFKTLRKMGIKGFGLYDNFTHLDDRPEGGKQADQHGTYALWDNRVIHRKKKTFGKR